MKLSSYQEKIIDAFENTTDNLFISARAGAGKTFILENIANRIETPSLFLAFNKAIQKEAEGKILKQNIKCYTFNAVGYRILMHNSRDIRPTININKTNHVIFDMIDKEVAEDAFEDSSKFDYITLTEIWNLVRNNLVNFKDISCLKQFLIDYGYNYRDFNLQSLSSLLNIIDKNNDILYDTSGEIDFIDQIYLTIKNLESGKWRLPSQFCFSHILVDEAQDTNFSEQELVKLLCNVTTRCIFVGDRYQSIYLFAGSDVRAYQNILEEFSCTEYTLPICYRCPQSHIEYVNEHIKDIEIKPFENAEKGTIKSIFKHQISDYVTNSSFILSRRNSDLIEICFLLLEDNCSIYIENKQLLNKISNYIKRNYSESLGIVHFENILKEAIKHNDEEFQITEECKILDQNDLLQCVLILIKNLKNTLKTPRISKERICQYITKMLGAEDTKESIKLMSIHRAKGLEANTVFVLHEAEPFIQYATNKHELQQEVNLSYVALTRSTNNLYLVKDI